MSEIPPEADDAIASLSSDIRATVERWLDRELEEVAAQIVDEIRSVVALHLADGIIQTFGFRFLFRLADGRVAALHVDQDSASWEWR